jgi:hypothetical protein
MKLRTSIELTIDIDQAREMGIEIADNEVEDYAINETLEYLHTLSINNEAHEVISVEILEGEQV